MLQLTATESPFEVGLVTRNLDAMLKFYTQVLGLASGQMNEVPGRGRVARLWCGKAIIKFVEPVPAPETGLPGSSLVDLTGIRYLTMIVTNGAELYRRFEEEHHLVPGSRLENEHRMLFAIRDPDGNLIEILEHFH